MLQHRNVLAGGDVALAGGADLVAGVAQFRAGRFFHILQLGGMLQHGNILAGGNHRLASGAGPIAGIAQIGAGGFFHISQFLVAMQTAGGRDALGIQQLIAFGAAAMHGAVGIFAGRHIHDPLAGAMLGIIPVIAANRTFMPMVGVVLGPNRFIFMGGAADAAANITANITAVIVGVLQLADLRSLGAAAFGAGVGFFAFTLTGRRSCHLTFIPAMLHLLLILTNGANMLMVGFVHIGPLAKAMALGRHRFLAGMAAIGAGVGHNAGSFTAGLGGQHAVVIPMRQGNGLAAGLAHLKVVGIVLFPFSFADVGGFPNIAAEIAIRIAGMIVGMGRFQFFGQCRSAYFAGKGLDARGIAAGLGRYLARIVVMPFGHILAAIGANAAVATVLPGPAFHPVGMLGGNLLRSPGRLRHPQSGRRQQRQQAYANFFHIASSESASYSNSQLCIVSQMGNFDKHPGNMQKKFTIFSWIIFEIY